MLILLNWLTVRSAVAQVEWMYRCQMSCDYTFIVFVVPVCESMVRPCDVFLKYIIMYMACFLAWCGCCALLTLIGFWSVASCQVLTGLVVVVGKCRARHVSQWITRATWPCGATRGIIICSCCHWQDSSGQHWTKELGLKFLGGA